MRRSLCVGLIALFMGVGCDDSGRPTLSLDTLPDCSSGGTECMDRAPSMFEVDGVRVLHQRITGHPLLAIQIKFDVVDEPGAMQVWAESLALGMAQWAGPTGLGTVEFPARLADLNAEFSTSAGLDYRSIYVTVPPPRFRAMWELLNEILDNPATDDFLLEGWRRNYKSNYASERDQAASAASIEAFGRLFRGEFTNERRETQAALDSVQVGHVREAWRALRTKRRLLVAVAGDLAEKELREAVHGTFAGWDDDYAPRLGDVERELAPTGNVAVLDYPESPTWHVRSYFRGPAADSEDYAVLALGLSVLGDRLFDQVRDAEGLAYTTGAGASFYRQTYGSIWMSTQAPHEAFAIAHDNIVALKNDGPDEDELARARESLRAAELTGADTPAAVAGVLADWVLTAGSLDAQSAYLDALDGATVADVAAVLTTYLQDVTTAAAGSGEETLAEEDLAGLYE